jgi:biotin carboxylase
MTPRHVVVVDPYSSGVLYAPALRRAGFSPVAVRSVPMPAPQFTSAFRPEDFDAQYLADGNFAELVRTLAGKGVLAVLPGSESGVALADRLAARLTPKLAHVPALASHRRHKGLMTAAVGAAGLPVTPTLTVRDPSEATDWLADPCVAGHDLVIKPATSVSTDGVTLAPGGTGAQSIVAGLLGKTNAAGLTNDEVVIQRRLFGVEYVVNTFSHDGRHTVTDICRYAKDSEHGNFAVYKDVEFLPAGGPGHGGPRRAGIPVRAGAHRDHADG